MKLKQMGVNVEDLMSEQNSAEEPNSAFEEFEKAILEKVDLSYQHKLQIEQMAVSDVGDADVSGNQTIPSNLREPWVGALKQPFRADIARRTFVIVRPAD